MAFTTTLTNGTNFYQVPLTGPYAGDWYLDAMDGNDSLIGFNGNDTFLGGNGDDWMISGGGLDRIYGESGNDSIYGENDRDYLDGGSGTDYVNGGTHNDTLIGGGAAAGYLNADELIGHSGDDFYYHDFAAGGISIIDDLSGGELNNADLLYLANVSGPLSLNWGSDRSTLFIYQAGELDDGTFDNGVMITGMLSNLGVRTAGTIENFYINGSAQSTWLTVVENGWHGAFG